MSASFLWESHGLDKSRFEAYAKLLRLRNGGQIEEASHFSEKADEQMELADLNDTDSIDMNTLSPINNNKLKRSFLDRLSELVANEKGGPYVSSSLMIEWPDRVDILVAKNNGIKEGDPSISMLETIASDLQVVSRLDLLNPAAIAAMEHLWTSLVRSYRLRLINYMVEVKQTLKKTSLSAAKVEPPALHDHQPSLLSHLEEFRALVNDPARSSTQDGLEEAVHRAYDMCSLYNEQEFEKAINNNSSTRSLRNSLGFLGRLRTCFNTLIRGADRLANFQNLRILPAAVLPTSRARPKKLRSTGHWSAVKTFLSLDLTLDDKTVESVVGTGKKKQSWTKTKLLQKFDKLKSSVSEVHAEVQVILAAARHDCTGALIFGYVGCSKRSCFLCSRFVHSYGSFTTRGCHGKLYDLWTVPELSWFTEEERSKLANTLKHVETAMKDSIRNKKTGGLVHAQESTIGGSSVATIRQQFDNPYMSSLVSQYLESQREDLGVSTTQEDDLKSQSLSSEHVYEATLDLPPLEHTQGQSPRTTPTPEQTRGECEICERDTGRCCAHCNLDWFCSQKCQDQMSLHHLTKCSARSITSADILYSDALYDRIPEDEQAREHFGFSRCRDRREESHLFGLYRGFLIYRDIGPIQLNEWRQKGTLVSKIIEIFSEIPEQSRGSYYPWFLRNQHVLDHATPPLHPVGENNPLQQALNAARSYLEPEDCDKEFHQLEPPAKRYCFIFYAISLDSAHPNPNWVELDLWYDFGFALCTNRYEEDDLGRIYNKLVSGNKYFKDYDQSLGVGCRDMPDSPTCSFGEFWRAWQDGSLAKLFDKYGLGDEIDEYPSGLEYKTWVRHLRGFISFPVEQHALRPSVWRLKHLLALEDVRPLTSFPKIEAAVRDYGFTPQLDARTKIALRQFYRQLLKEHDPLEVHEAKNRGELLEYAERRFKDLANKVQNVLVELSPTRSKP
ncbi:hypothetical protein AK830_g4100 [Neonectria ditissima]|uniref:MYND-type domain-containing protein n=1 Tax=Neonectria ditissima TaxID=78410 RepID=A0A0P7BPJ6_9HYPO|nr:hypothetical protein AK830_g4100 [Neonectria ditissima]